MSTDDKALPDVSFGPEGTDEFLEQTRGLFGSADGAEERQADSLLAYLDEPLARADEAARLAAGCLVGGVLLNGPSDPATVEAVKNTAKMRSRRAPTPEDRAAAKVVYYAAIASALVRHGRRISRLSDSDLLAAFDWMQAEQWVDPAIADLAARAAACLRRGGPAG